MLLEHVGLWNFIPSFHHHISNSIIHCPRFVGKTEKETKERTNKNLDHWFASGHWWHRHLAKELETGRSKCKQSSKYVLCYKISDLL